MAGNASSRGGSSRGAPQGLGVPAGDRGVRPVRPAHGVHYTGPNGDYPGYVCQTDQDQTAAPSCQEVRALAVDASVAGPAGGAQAGPDRDGLGRPRAGGPEAGQLERQWALRRERARYEAERARRQYDAVEPENRLVARSLERVWEEKLRVVERVEQDYDRWRREQPLVLGDDDRDALWALGRDLPQVWRAATAADRKRILRFIVREVILDQRSSKGMSGSRSSGRPVQPASIPCSAVFTPTTTTPISISCGSGSRS